VSACFAAQQMCQACGGRLCAGHPGILARGVSTDTRTLAAGEAFLALIGPNHDGHEFVPQALEAGASLIVAQRREPSWRLRDDVGLILVDDTTQALMDLAAWHRDRLNGKVIAITGSCGKSTVKTMTAAALKRCRRCTAAPKSYNNRIGVSLTLLAADPADEFVVLEMGTNHHGEIDELAGLARPHAGLITCIGDSHLQELGDRRGVMEAKAELIPHLPPDGLLVLNADDALCMELAERHAGEVTTFGFSVEADVRPTALRCEGKWQLFEIAGQTFRLPVPGRHNVLNAAGALCLSGWAGVPLQQASEALATVRLPALRFERHQIGSVNYVLDCYNSNPTAFCAALLTFLKQCAARRRLVVCGDMLELGAAGPYLHTLLGRALALTQVDMVVAVGPLGRYVVRGWREFAGEHGKALHVPTADEAWEAVQANVGPGDAVLIKGSRAMQLEKIPQAIAKQMGASQKQAVA